eukprot:1461070-Lingulodinium_polyedra.AAC.1
MGVVHGWWARGSLRRTDQAWTGGWPREGCPFRLPGCRVGFCPPGTRFAPCARGAVWQCGGRAVGNP